MQSDDDWEPEPAQVTPGTRYDLLRCGSGALPPVICLSPDSEGRSMHFWRGRSYPHHKNECPACAARNIAVWKGYVAVWIPKSRLISILEFTFPCLDAVKAYRAAHGHLRTATLDLSRSGKRANGPLKLQITPSQWGSDQLPPNINVKEQLLRIWDGRNAAEHFAEANPRDYTPPATTTDEVIKRRAVRGPVRITPDPTDLTVPLSTLSDLVKDILEPGIQKRNGEAKHD